MKYKYIGVFLLTVLVLSSCTGVKNLRYIQSQNELLDTVNYKINSKDYKLMKGDNIYINIMTSNEEFQNFVSPKSNKSSNTTSANPAGLYLLSFSVDKDGLIYLPFIGEIKAGSKTISELRLEIQTALEVYLTDVTVDVKLINFGVTVMGEVNRPGQYFATGDKLNLLQALGMAGDLTIYGSRKNIKLLRLTENGDYKIHRFDIRYSDVLADEYFFLQPGDIVYVEPLGTKPFGLGAFTVGTMASTITALIVILNFFK